MKRCNLKKLNDDDDDDDDDDISRTRGSIRKSMKVLATENVGYY
jgi:hypothetical protein